MLYLALFLSLALWSSFAEAIRWDFDGETTQGWAAKKSISSGGRHAFHLLSSVVEDGVWAIEAFRSDDHNPSVEVISPTIDYDSHLFDQVRIRFRTIHQSPTLGVLSLHWTNEHNLTSPGRDPKPAKGRFGILVQGDFVYTTEWQEVEIGLANRSQDIWDGMLQDIRLGFSLDFSEIGVPRPAAEKVGGLEIDWIELTGVEEILQGELPPPQAEYFRFEGGGHFAPPVFHPIVPGLGGDFVFDRAGVLTDVDGDGDLDLCSAWEDFPPKEWPTSGWVVARNDGEGAFKSALTKETTGSATLLEIYAIYAGDLTGDGQDEIVTEDRNNWEITIWSIGLDLQIEVLTQINGRWLVDMVDGDGDGRVELFTTDFTVEDKRALEVWEVKQGVWTVSQMAVAENHWPARMGDFTGDGKWDVLWKPRDQTGTWIVAHLGNALEAGDVVFEETDTDTADILFYLLQVGDFDGDGQVDLLTPLKHNPWELRKGLVIRGSRLGGGVGETVLYDERLFLRSPVVVHDLNGDGVDDWVFVGGERASGIGVFVEWGGGANPAKTVERHRLAGDGVQVLPGDVDGDGDVDLVVLDPILGGVQVLKSSVAEQMTAVLTSEVARPAQHRLGDSYPNPFNPAVVLPLELATDAAQVSLTVYDVLGRRVRQVW